MVIQYVSEIEHHTLVLLKIQLRFKMSKTEGSISKHFPTDDILLCGSPGRKRLITTVAVICV